MERPRGTMVPVERPGAHARVLQLQAHGDVACRERRQAARFPSAGGETRELRSDPRRHLPVQFLPQHQQSRGFRRMASRGLLEDELGACVADVAIGEVIRTETECDTRNTKQSVRQSLHRTLLLHEHLAKLGMCDEASSEHARELDQLGVEIVIVEAEAGSLASGRIETRGEDAVSGIRVEQRQIESFHIAKVARDGDARERTPGWMVMRIRHGDAVWRQMPSLS